MGKEYTVVVDKEAGFHVFDTIVERWKAEPKMFPYDHPRAIIPQNLIPNSVRDNVETLCNFYFYVCLYMRGNIESIQAFRGLIAMYEKHPDFFDPLFAQGLSQEVLQPILARYVGRDSFKVSGFWIENSRRLTRNWNASTKKLFAGIRSFNEGVRRIKNKLTKRDLMKANETDGRGEGFQGFQEKMVSMLIYFMDWEGLLKHNFLYPTPADFHNFRLGFGLGIMKLKPFQESVRVSDRISKPWRNLTMRYLRARRETVTPVELADAIWLFSLAICSESPLTTYHEKEKTFSNEYGMFDEELLPQTTAPPHMDPKLKGRIARTCLSCPVISRCRFAVPAYPYYQNGLLTFWERFPVERHTQLLTPDYLPRGKKPRKEVEQLSAL